MIDSFGSRLREVREDKCLKQKDLAELLSCSPSVLSNYEKGIRFPDQQTLLAICRALEVSADYLIGNLPKYKTIHTENRTIVKADTRRMEFHALFDSLSEENQAKVFDYIDLIIKAERADIHSKVNRELKTKANSAQKRSVKGTLQKGKRLPDFMKSKESDQQKPKG